MSLKIYVVSTLIGDEVVNTGVYSSKENAELFCENDPDTTIDELTLDKYLVEVRMGQKCYEVRFDAETDEVVWFEHLPFRFYESDKAKWMNIDGQLTKFFWAFPSFRSLADTILPVPARKMLLRQMQG